MPYKDREKQRIADKERQKRRRDKIKAKGVTKQGVTQGVTATSIANKVTAHLAIENYGQPDCECWHCQNNGANGSKHILNHSQYKPVAELAENELNRVSLPGDSDNDGVCLDSKYDSRRRPSSLACNGLSQKAMGERGGLK